MREDGGEECVSLPASCAQNCGRCKFGILYRISQFISFIGLSLDIKRERERDILYRSNFGHYESERGRGALSNKSDMRQGTPIKVSVV